jgi:succinate-acetate transporter protein
LFIAAIWAINLGAGAVATVFGLFSMFWLSFALLVLGTTHGWFVSSAVEPEAAATAGAGGTIVYLITWTAAVVVLTLATLRLPLAFTALFALVALALFLVLLFNLTSDTIWATIAGYVAFGAAGIGV